MDQRIQAFIGTMSVAGLQMKDVSISNVEGANRTIGIVDKALEIVSKQRADLGAIQNRLDLLIKGTDISAQNLQASESYIRDTNMAMATVNLSRDIILSQASAAMLA